MNDHLSINLIQVLFMMAAPIGVSILGLLLFRKDKWEIDDMEKEKPNEREVIQKFLSGFDYM